MKVERALQHTDMCNREKYSTYFFKGLVKTAIASKRNPIIQISRHQCLLGCGKKKKKKQRRHSISGYIQN